MQALGARLDKELCERDRLPSAALIERAGPCGLQSPSNSGEMREEKPYREHISTQSPSLSPHLKGYQQPLWNQVTRDTRKPTSSQTTSPKDWSPTTGLYSWPADPDDNKINPGTLNMDRLAPNLHNPSSLHQAYGPPGTEESHLNPQGLHQSIQSFINGLTTSMLRGGRKKRTAGGRVSIWGGGQGTEVEESVGARGSDRDHGEESASAATQSMKKSQYEPLDLSLRPDWLLSSQAVSAHKDSSLGELTGLIQEHRAGSDGNPSSSTNRLHAPTGQHKAQSDWTEPGSGTGCDPETPREQEDRHVDDSSAQDTEGAPENHVYNNMEGNTTPNKLRRKRGTRDAGPSEETTEMMADRLQECPQEKQGQRSVIQPLLSLRPKKPRQTPHQPHHRNLLSVIQTSIRHNQTLLNGPAASFNGGEFKERAETSGGKPFLCKYCPYSATQKGNLKTHVLCVHRRPFDSSLYPDRRLRRPHSSPPVTQQGSTGSSHLPKSMGPEKAPGPTSTGRDTIMTSMCGGDLMLS
ncbi:hypothetical protein DPEC_G00163980 [Dallia pectoralis]|uniref:Uncharacterized protein n=1 Tax=Dallia pectoralis TaxID=75939 RepID=A0ACC2GHJ8_DALPE|nr:hypothetical protein DPEC_G00163980 [Dallia pectoralis]